MALFVLIEIQFAFLKSCIPMIFLEMGKENKIDTTRSGSSKRLNPLYIFFKKFIIKILIIFFTDLSFKISSRFINS